ncbi:unnamed protein product [Closterium sp. NIES-64]|nr:unnamed protein product [Closterium sp. NIES-64]
MKFSIYFPPAATSSRVPVIYWLSGLTCTDENFIQKSFAQKYASEHGVALIVPDTSPRKLPHPPPSPHPSLCTRRPGNARKPASEHGVGLIVPDISPRKLPILPLKLPCKLPLLLTAPSLRAQAGLRARVALIVPDTSPLRVRIRPHLQPTECPWGQKAFTGYLGTIRQPGRSMTPQRSGSSAQGFHMPFKRLIKVAREAEYDATALVKQYPGLPCQLYCAREQYPGPKVDILIDQGDSSKFYHEKQLLSGGRGDSDKFDHEKHLLPEVGDSDKFDHEKQLLPENFQKARTEAS